MPNYRYTSFQWKNVSANILFNTNTDAKDFSIKEFGHNKSYLGYKKVFIPKDYYLHYVINGKGRFMDSEFEAGNGFIIQPNTLAYHEVLSDSAEHCWMLLAGENIPELLASCNIPTENKVFTNPHGKEIAKFMKDIVFQDYTGLNLDLSLKSAAYKILAHHKPDIGSQMSSNILQSEYIIKATTYIKEHISSPLLNTTDIAKTVNVTPNHLCKLFKKHLNYSVKDYIITYKITIAEQLLEQTSYSIAQISTYIGYNDPMYFSQIFRKYTGQTPTEYRKSHNH